MLTHEIYNEIKWRLKVQLRVLWLHGILKTLPSQGGGVEGRHSSPPFIFAKKLRKGGLFLRTFFRIKIYPAVQKLLASQGF